MPACTITRTHERGRKRSDWDADPIPGPVTFGVTYIPELNRHIECLRVERGHYKDGRPRPDALPPLLEPQIRTFMSDRAMMVSGFEQIDGCRYYQGWFIQWVDGHVRPYQTSEITE